MIIIMKPNYTPQQLEGVIAAVKKHGLTPHITYGVETAIVAAVGELQVPSLDPLKSWTELKASSASRNRINLALVRCIPKTPSFRLTGFRSAGMTSSSSLDLARWRVTSQILETAQAVREAGERPARRSLQTAHVPVFVSGARRGRSRISCRGARSHRHAHRSRDHVADAT